MQTSSLRRLTFALVPLLAAAVLDSGCSPSGSSSLPASLRPGDQDSSKAFQGTSSPAEAAFWQAVRNGDDAARDQAVTQLKKDAAADPTDGYSAFLAGASAFMPPTDLARALAAGQNIPAGHGGGAPPATTGPLFQQALGHLADPLYIGFAYTLLAFVQADNGDFAAATASQKQAVAHNIPASSVGQVNAQLGAADKAGALDTMRNMLDFCNGAALDRNNPDLNSFVDKANAGVMQHRECYSGYFGPHATEGELLLVGDLLAATGDMQGASLYYKATQRSASYASWPLRPLAERRISGAQRVKDSELAAIASCTTCHTNALP